MVMKTEAISNYLRNSTHAELAELYTKDMEVQVLAAQDEGERVAGKFNDRSWQGFTDNLTTWKHIRIPWNANTVPKYEDSKMTWELDKHAEGIGMTGWDWKNRCSKWVAFDFDAITGHSDRHSAKLSDEEIKKVEKEASKIKWVTIRKSTSGQGLHIYVFVPDIPTSNHCEHAGLARAILHQMSALTGFSFTDKVDVCGSNMWVFHRKMKGTDGLKLIKKGTTLESVPPNWRDHIKVTSGKKSRATPKFVTKDINGNTNEDVFNEVSGQSSKVPLDSEHSRLIDYLSDTEALWWFDQDHHMLVCHTSDLKDAHTSLKLKGIFETEAEGLNKGDDQNCFAFPMRKGAWAVRRHSPGVKEKNTWEQDGKGWTRCIYNKEPSIPLACHIYGASEDERGFFIFRESEMAIKSGNLLGIDINIPTAFATRECKLKEHKDGRLIVHVDKKDGDDYIEGWIKDKKVWKKIFATPHSSDDEPEIVGDYDDQVRHLVSDNKDCGWVVNSGEGWRFEPVNHVKFMFQGMGIDNNTINLILGGSVMKAWRLVNKPFQAEYLGDRQWNRDAAQICYKPSGEDKLYFPTWQKILKHCGQDIDNDVKKDSWCKRNGILTGEDYLKNWIACIFKYPEEPLPYLFFYGPQNSGKSVFHEAFNLLVTKGCIRADNALKDQNNFNGELKNAVMCVVEETNLNKQKSAYNKIKDWVTSKEICIRELYRTPIMVPNTTHWVQCANEYDACPIFPNDTRITMFYVPELENEIPKRDLLVRLRKEAPDFMQEIMNLEIPLSDSRLAMPIINTDEKRETQKLYKTELDEFISERLHKAPGEWITFSEFKDSFRENCKSRSEWSPNRISREIKTLNQLIGRNPKDSTVMIGNVSWNKQFKKPDQEYFKDGQQLRLRSIETS